MIKIGNYKTDIVPIVLGKGTYAIVYLGYNNCGEKVAIKVIEKRTIIKNNTSIVENEINIMNFLKLNPHENIVKCIDIFENENFAYIILEYCNTGTLYDFLEKVKLSKNKFIPESYVKYFFIQIINGFTFLKKHNIVHRDIKTKNILISNNKDIKIADFGLAHKGDSLMDTICGSPLAMPPEMIKKCMYHDNFTNYDDSIDIWSLGIMLYQMIYGINPYNIETGTITTIYDFQKFETIIIPREDMPHIILSDECTNLLKKMLQKDFTKRIKWNFLCSDPWITNLGYVIQPLETTHESIIPLGSSPLKYNTIIYHNECEIIDDYIENMDKYTENSIFDIEIN